MADRLGILLLSGEHERAHYAFVVAAGAAAIGRTTVLFATNEGTRALLRDWSGLAGSGRDVAVRAAGVAGLEELREAAASLGVRLLACDSGLAMAGVDPAGLVPEAEVSGIAAFLAEVGAAPIVTL